MHQLLNVQSRNFFSYNTIILLLSVGYSHIPIMNHRHSALDTLILLLFVTFVQKLSVYAEIK